MADGRRLLLATVALVAVLSLASSARSQTDSFPAGGFGGAPGSGDGTVLTVEAQYVVPSGGQPAQLAVTAALQTGWHIYSTTQQRPYLATKINVTTPGVRLLGPFQPDPPPAKSQDPDKNPLEMHEGKVTWYAPIELPSDAPANLKIEGRLNAQACDANGCYPPRDYPFAAVMAAQAPPSAPPRGGWSSGFSREMPAKAGTPATGVAPAPPPVSAALRATPPLDMGTLATKLAFAFLGGLILNLMPCVLPVISLKILSFLEQAHESRARVFALNVWYSAGLMAVFLVLAGLAVTANQSWGEQFTSVWFKVAMTGLVFAMALAFLGVWEIPIPGFIGAGRAEALQTREGATGAFFKGVFATLLATPCSGPFLGPVFGYLLTQPPIITYCIFGAVGLGMATPYLVIGAFPQLLRFLPKPGAWMETLQQVMAFLLLGTVVYLFTTLKPIYFVPTLTLLVGIWFGTWLIGTTPFTASYLHRGVIWAASIASAALVGWFGFTVLLHEPILPWQPFSPAALAQARREGKTVMVDFSADWCLTCKTNLKFAIDTDAVRDLVKKNDIVPLLADWTDESPIIKQALNELGCNSIPVLAIWSASEPTRKPVVLTDLLRPQQVLDALAAAGPSRPGPTGNAPRAP